MNVLSYDPAVLVVLQWQCVVLNFVFCHTERPAILSECTILVYAARPYILATLP